MALDKRLWWNWWRCANPFFLGSTADHLRVLLFHLKPHRGTWQDSSLFKSPKLWSMAIFPEQLQSHPFGSIYSSSTSALWLWGLRGPGLTSTRRGVVMEIYDYNTSTGSLRRQPRDPTHLLMASLLDLCRNQCEGVHSADTRQATAWFITRGGNLLIRHVLKAFSVVFCYWTRVNKLVG